MGLTTNIFLFFIILLLFCYYLTPLKRQWIVLLIFSYAFYVYSDFKAVFFLVASTLITYGAASWMEKIGDTVKERKLAKQKKKNVLIGAIILNIGILCVLKYTNFCIQNVSTLIGREPHLLHLILPLGISYYTFQSTGYMLDVYWNKTKAERNIFKYALFVSFFPYMVQGPINRFSSLAYQLYEGHSFDSDRLKSGGERILWGLFKKMVLADWAAVYADAIFGNTDKYSGLAIFALLLYTVELYGNFSGGIDVVIGIAEMLGITMEENFKRPFFAVSVTDFWHRWHITLGTWMKEYVFYPMTLSKAMKNTGKFCKNVFGKKIGRNIPICITNLVVFLLVGIWHGPTWGNIGWGFYNGVIIAFSGLFADGYKVIKTKLKIDDKSKGYHVFMIVRTFIIMNISWYFDCVSSFGEAVKMMKYSVTRFAPSQFMLIAAGKNGTEFTPYALAIICGGCLLWFVISLLQEKGVKIREKIAELPWCVQILIGTILFISIPLLGPMSVARGFIYAQF